MCAGKVGAGSSSLVMCPRKKGAVSNSSAASLMPGEGTGRDQGRYYGSGSLWEGHCGSVFELA